MRILLADDHPLFLDGLKSIMSLHGFDVVGTAEDGREALEKARALQPDVILMDVHMPNLNGLEATRLIKAELPDIKIVMLSMSEGDEDLFEAIKSGASGYLLKTDDTDRFFEFLSGLMKGESPLSPGMAGRVLKELGQRQKRSEPLEQPVQEEESLTPRQIQVLKWVAQGLTYKEVGVKLFLSERTIKYHMGEIINRLHLENRRQVVEFARRRKLTSG